MVGETRQTNVRRTERINKDTASIYDTLLIKRKFLKNTQIKEQKQKKAENRREYKKSVQSVALRTEQEKEDNK